MKPQIINLFPLSIYKAKLELAEEYKDELINEILIMKKNSTQPEYQKKGDAWTGDTQGHDKLFDNKKFIFFFDQVSKHIKKYVEYFDINIESIDCYYQRSWATLSNNVENIKVHNHVQSHLSFAYYLKKSSKDANIQFVDRENPNEFIPSLFNSSTINLSQIFKNRNLKNINVIDMNCVEDDMLIFPSKTQHGTQSYANNDERISISADIIFCAKNAKNLEHMMPSLNEWKKF